MAGRAAVSAEHADDPLRDARSLAAALGYQLVAYTARGSDWGGQAGDVHAVALRGPGDAIAAEAVGEVALEEAAARAFAALAPRPYA